MNTNTPVKFTCGGWLMVALWLWGTAAHAQVSFLDARFNPGIGATNGLVETVLQQSDGKILVCGNFTTFNGLDRPYIARLNNDGSVDMSFNARPGYWVRHMAQQPDGKIVIGGFFTSVAGQSRNLLARLNTDGTLDTTFDPGTGAKGTLGVSVTGNPDPFVFQLALQGDGKILITGNFTNYNGTTIYGIARVNPGGTLDTTFQVASGLDTWGRSIQVLANNQILVTGWFNNYHNQSHNKMALINPDGTPDTSFNPYIGDRTAIYSAVRLANGKYIVAGHSLNTAGLFRQEMARLNADGSFDTNFTAYANEKIQSVRLQADGKILLGGEFSQVNGVPRTSIARLNADGSLDDTFKATVDNYIWTVHLPADGLILISGGFYNIDGVSRNGVARLLATIQPRLASPTKNGQVFSVSVQTQAGKNYVLQYRGSLSVTNWTSLPGVIGNGSVQTLSDTAADNSNRFYRVWQN